jgi:hypothetical protein
MSHTNGVNHPSYIAIMIATIRQKKLFQIAGASKVYSWLRIFGGAGDGVNQRSNK